MRLSRLIATAALLFSITPAWASTVSFDTPDGVTISGSLLGSGAKGVLLVHNKGRDNSDWGTFHTKLSTKGFHVLAIDLRGHGESGGSKPASEDDFKSMVADVTAGVSFLKGQGVTQIAIVGAELGANLAANAASENTDVTNLILLSAGMNISGVRSGSAVEGYGDRPILIVASEEETYANRSAAYLEGKAKGKMHVEILNNAGAGTKMLTRDPQLEGIVLAWLNDTFFLTEGGGGAQKDLNTSNTGAIETTGKQFGESREEQKKEAAAEPMEAVDFDE